MKFRETGFNHDIMRGLEAMNFVEMTPVQEETIPVILEGRDLIGCAQTGTGKTAAYTLPLLNRLVEEGNPDNHVKTLIVVPTRELAQQIDQQFEGFAYFLPVSHTVVYGGGDGRGWDIQKQGMVMGAEIVIATPGRLIAHLQNSGIDLSHVKYLVLDEADRMLDMGFFDDIMTIVKQLPTERQTLMFSATLPPKIRQLARQILKNPAEINIAVSKPNEAIEQSAYICREDQKMGLIGQLFPQPEGSRTIIFSSSKQKVKNLAFALKRMQLNVAAMHSDLEQAQREAVMLDFRNGKVNILVATDVVSRGIDIDGIGLILNYDVPHDPEDYIHRIGRTARADATGTAITFVGNAEQGKFHRIEQLIEREIPKVALPESVGPGPAYQPDLQRRGNDGRRPHGKRRSQGSAQRGGGERSGRNLRTEHRDRAENREVEAPRPSAEDGAIRPVQAGQPVQPGEAPRRKRKRGGKKHRRSGNRPQGEPRSPEGASDARISAKPADGNRPNSSGREENANRPVRRNRHGGNRGRRPAGGDSTAKPAEIHTPPASVKKPEPKPAGRKLFGFLRFGRKK